MAKPPCTPLHIIAHVADGRIVSNDGVIMFDAILYHAWFLKHAPHVLRGEAPDEYNGHIGLPLRQLPGNRYAASRGVYTEISKSVERYNKRPDFFAADKLHYLDMDKGIISDGVGLYRAYRNPVVVRTIEDGRIDWWCVGTKDKIIDLLSYIPAVGKKPSMGWGIVDNWQVEDADADYSLQHPEHGLMRPAPIADGVDYPGYPIMRYGIRPPYWKAKNFDTCYVPVSAS